MIRLLRYFPEAKEEAYPEPGMFGKLPATGLWARTARNLELSNFEVETAYPDNRPAVWLEDVDGADILNRKAPRGAFLGLQLVRDVRVAGSRHIPDFKSARVEKDILTY